LRGGLSCFCSSQGADQRAAHAASFGDLGRKGLGFALANALGVGLPDLMMSSNEIEGLVFAIV